MNELSRELRDLRNGKDYSGLIHRVREAITEDRVGAMMNWHVKNWCGLRWRNLFITEAVKDPVALGAAKQLKAITKRGVSDRQWIAERYLREGGRDDWSIEMPEVDFTRIKNTTFIFCPGLLNGLLPVRAFQTSLPEIEFEYGIRILRADLHPLAGCDRNAENLAEAIELGIGLSASREVIDAENATPPQDVFLMGYSKGVADILTLLVKRPDLAPRIRCVFGWAAAAGGSYLGDDAYEIMKDLKEDPKLLSDLIKKVSPIASLPEIVERRQSETEIKTATLHLTTGYRQAFLREHEDFINELGIPIFNLTGSTSVTKVPTFQAQGVAQLNRYDSNNDMQVTQDQARIQMPMATDLAMLNAHHWDMSYEAFPKSFRATSPHLDHPFPKKAALMANFQLVNELGLIN